jgi:DNA-binding transcriptional ArsR family regulator
MKSKTAIAALSALAQETRLEVFRLLVREGPEGRPAGAIAERLGIPAPTLSFHLAQLVRAGLALARRDGRTIHYAANYGGMNALLTYLTEDCCQGRPEICGAAVARVGCGPSASPAADKPPSSRKLGSPRP